MQQHRKALILSSFHLFIWGIITSCVLTNNCFVLAQHLADNKSYTDGALFRENFESGSPEWVTANRYLKRLNYNTRGIDGKIIKATYIPNETGSPYLSRYFKFDSVTSATLSYDFKLHSQFEFVKGGKMHGLGGGSASRGCGDIDPNGWSVRLMWREEGAVEAYIYHQDRKNRCGDRYPNPDFRLTKGQWYRVDLQVKMNSDPNVADGWVKLFMNGTKLVEATELRLTGNSSVNIDEFMFNTFYGGSNPSWAPSKPTYAYFDNFSVRPGHRVTGEQGSNCEIFQEGIYHPNWEICCSESCGSCGGSGCSQLEGGADECCVGVINNDNNFCSPGYSNAPCKYN